MMMNSLAAASSSSPYSPCLPSTQSSTTVTLSLLKFHIPQFFPVSSASSLPPHPRVLCHAKSPSSPQHDFVLHRVLDSSGITTAHAREARQGYVSQIERLSSIEREVSISINRRVDLAKTALYIAAEDDSIVSHSSVPLPVDAFVDRIDDLSMDFCTCNAPSLRASPEILLESLERYLYDNKGFRRSSVSSRVDPRSLYLHSVLTHRSGSAPMLTLIYSEILKILRLWGLLTFDCELFFPHDLHGLPRGYHKQKSRESDHAHIMTSQTLLQEVLRDLKEAFWPFPHDQTKSLFLKAADAANYVDRSHTMDESAFQIASAKAAHHRLDRGVWTSVWFGDMRRALAGMLQKLAAVPFFLVHK